ncbi:proline--tRNA ligase [Candidatus Pacearchaeota archaeon]|nr:proline--tRNA ligase [Candidatus Pacearchaeota archaeon]|tara:strand:+ start:293 stop:1747 length:1455 start_codon:yes stop_codon:yes gene_type:complete
MSKNNKDKDIKGITAEKDELSEWYTQILQKAELIEYTDVSGAYILRPGAYFIWEKVKEFFDNKIKKDGVKNASFPLLISKSNLMREQEHVEGFTPEVAWVTRSGSTELAEPLAVRPTSETVIYPAYSKWIRSWKDLPLRLNQWCNVVRWEFNNPVPFIRSREFLWQEGHTAFETREQADSEVRKIQDFYVDVYKEMYAIPVIKGIKTDKEKFAGADYTSTVEAFLPSGKAAQGATSHLLGQNFAKAFDIQFLDKNGKKQYVWQNSWGISTRSIGIAIMTHSDDKGLILPPKVAETQIIIVPIFNKKSEKSLILNKAKEIKESLSEFRVEIDAREDHSPGYKFNDWEMKGVPLRIEIGPRDLAEDKAVLVRRDNKLKEDVKIKDIDSKVKKTLETIHKFLYNKAKKFIKDNTEESKDMKSLIAAIKNKKLVRACWDGSLESEDWIKDKTGGAKIICIIDEKIRPNDKCVYSGKKAKFVVYIGKSY